MIWIYFYLGGASSYNKKKSEEFFPQGAYVLVISQPHPLLCGRSPLHLFLHAQWAGHVGVPAETPVRGRWGHNVLCAYGLPHRLGRQRARYDLPLQLLGSEWVLLLKGDQGWWLRQLINLTETFWTNCGSNDILEGELKSPWKEKKTSQWNLFSFLVILWIDQSRHMLCS